MNCEKEKVSKTVTIPKEFWKYFDLYRRQKITLEEYAEQTKLSQSDILFYLSVI